MLEKISVEEEEWALTPESTDVGRMARDLNALFKIAHKITTLRNIEALQALLLQLIGEVIPADSGAILMIPHIEGDPRSISTWHRDPDAHNGLNVRQEVVTRALCERSVVLSDFSSEDDELVLCAPLVGLQSVLGVIYLTARSTASRFPEDNVNLLTSVAGIAAVAMENILTLDSLRNENSRLREELTPAAHAIIGQSQAIRGLTALIHKVAQSDSSVLVHGESGTGKELVAVAIHQNSARREKPFVGINCAAIPEALLESELFGYEKGAFTGAAGSKRGKLEVAQDGTVFLDEIAELAPSLQAKLLRALQARQFERLGATQPIKFRARVIAATNKNLELAVKKGELRHDLFYRLNVVSIAVPSLRERREDVALLGSYFPQSTRTNAQTVW